MEADDIENTTKFELLQKDIPTLEQSTDEIPSVASEPPSIIQIMHEISKNPCIYFS